MVTITGKQESQREIPRCSISDAAGSYDVEQTPDYPQSLKTDQ